MKKNEIIVARVISTASASALALLILLVGIRSDYFLNVVIKINNNSISGEGANVYNYYYYTGLHVIFRFLYISTVLSLTVSLLSIFFRLKHTQMVCKIASICSLVTGVFLLFSRVYENSIGAHRMIDSIYMGNVSGSDIVTAQFLPKYPIWTILLIFVSCVLFFLVRATRFEKIKLYASKDGWDALHLLIAGGYCSIILDVVRDYLVYGLTSTTNASEMIAYRYLKEYFVSERWLLAIPFVGYSILTLVITMICRTKMSKRIHQIVSVGIPVFLVSVIGIYYMFNPAQIFVRLTLDEHVCDITESAMNLYLAQMISAVLFLSIFLYNTYMKLPLHKVLIMMGIHAALTLVLMVIGRFILALSGIYIGCILSDIICAVLTVFYSNQDLFTHKRKS